MSTGHEDDRATAGISRRSLLAVGAVGIPGVALVACSQAKSPDSRAAGSGSATGSSLTESSPAGSTSGSAASSSASAGGKPLAKLSDIKVGGSIAATGPDGGDIIITRPTATTVAAFSAVCTHQGCTVAPAGKELDCPCHGSAFDLNGAVLSGPAQRPLRAVKVRLSGEDVVAG